MFVARERELALLREQFSRDDRTAVLVYGKRRVGKSTLIAEAARTFDGTVVNHLCAKTTYEGNVALLCRSACQALGLPPITLPTIQDVFAFLAAQNRPILVVLDEYQYFKDSLGKGELDSYLQGVVDSLPAQVKLVLCGSYITVMRELLDEDNPLFGRLTAIVDLKELDYLDAARFSPALPVRDQIARYAVFGGSPYVLSQLDPEASLERNIKRLLVSPNSVLRTHIESIMLAEVRKSFDVRILHVLGNGRKRYSDIASALNGDRGGLLDKQLKTLIDMETIEKTSPINRQNDKRKTFYSIRDNLMRFYFCYLFATEGLVGRLGEDAFYASAVAPNLDAFISLRFEGIVAQYFSRLAKAGGLPGIEDIGTYWFDDKKGRRSGQFDCVLRQEGSYAFYEAKYYQRPMGLTECGREAQQVRDVVEIEASRMGFVCSAGFDFSSDEFDLVTGEDLYAFL